MSLERSMAELEKAQVKPRTSRDSDRVRLRVREVYGSQGKNTKKWLPIFNSWVDAPPGGSAAYNNATARSMKNFTRASKSPTSAAFLYLLARDAFNLAVVSGPRPLFRFTERFGCEASGIRGPGALSLPSALYGGIQSLRSNRQKVTLEERWIWEVRNRNHQRA